MFISIFEDCHFAIAAGALATIAFGVVPALRGSRISLAPRIDRVARSERARKPLSIGEAAGGRTGRALRSCSSSEPGCSPPIAWHLRPRISASMTAYAAGLDIPRSSRREVRDKLVPLFGARSSGSQWLLGVVAASPATRRLLDGGVDGGLSERTILEGRDAPAGPTTRRTVISPDYFRRSGFQSCATRVQ